MAPDDPMSDLARPIEQSGLTNEGRSRLLIGHLARLVLGLVFLLAGVAKAVDPAEFAHEIEGYGLVGPGLSAIAAPLLIAVEMTLGVALLLAFAVPAMAILSSAMILGFLGLKTYSLAAGRTDPCGCFGAYLQTSPGWGIVIDLGFLLAALLAFWGSRRRQAGSGRPALLALAGAGLASLGLALASPYLPLDSLVTRLTPGRTLRDLGIEGKVPGDGARLVALLDLTDPKSGETAALLDAFTSTPGAPTVLALTPSSEEEKSAFTWSANPTFEIQHVDRPILKPPGRRPLYRRLPRFFLVISGKVAAVYDGAPPAASDLISSEAP